MEPIRQNSNKERETKSEFKINSHGEVVKKEDIDNKNRKQYVKKSGLCSQVICIPCIGTKQKQNDAVENTGELLKVEET